MNIVVKTNLRAERPYEILVFSVVYNSLDCLQLEIELQLKVQAEHLA